MITIGGNRYKVVESFGFHNGKHVKEIEMPDGTTEIVAKYPGGVWEFYKPTLLPRSYFVGQEAADSPSVNAVDEARYDEYISEKDW